MILFDQFWSLYPKKMAKQDAMKAWKQLKVDDALFKTIMEGLSRAKGSKEWVERRFIPYPGTFLRGRRWEDEYTAIEKPMKALIKPLEAFKQDEGDVIEPSEIKRLIKDLTVSMGMP